MGFVNRFARKNKAKSLFVKAYKKNREIALCNLILLYNSRLRLKGSVDTFRIAVQYLVDIKDYEAINIIAGVVGYLGRWDELVAIMAKNTKTFDIGIEVLKEQFAKDLNAMEAGEPASQLAKWIPSVSINNNPMAHQIAKALGYSPNDYREIVNKLRSYIGFNRPD